MECDHLKILKKLGKVSLKIIFSLLGSFINGMVVPQDLIHLKPLSSSGSFFGI
jgi:hypothetical protein